MRLHEYEGKELFAEHGIAVPRGGLAVSAAEAEALAGELGSEVVVKAQVLAGGRGKAGGILTAANPQAAAAAAGKLLGSEVRGLRVEQVLVEEWLQIETELYLGVTVDSVVGRPVVLAGMGGVDVEAKSASDPAAVASARLDPCAGLPAALSRDLVTRAGIGRPGVAEALSSLYEIYSQYQALLVEINPLAVLGDGRLAAVDAVVEIDDSALDAGASAGGRWAPRAEAGAGPHAEVDGGMTYVEVDGEIGLICSGAGLGMATMDLISERARPANFLETGGGITRELMASAMRRVLRQKGLKGILINVYGGINPIHEGALGVADVMAEGVELPVVAKALGHRQEETWEILRAAGVTVYEGLDTEGAVAELVDRALDGERP